MATIQGVYIALFGRPADPLGLAFFNTQTKNGADLSGIGPLQTSAEYQTRFAGQTNTQIITSIYQSLFNRDPDLAGLTFFANALATGALSINNIAIAIYDGAQGADLTIRNLKEAAANAFTTAIDTVAEINGYVGTAAADSGRAFLAGVTTTAPTAAQVDAAVAAATTGNPVGTLVNLTAGVDTLTGTGGVETYVAVNSTVAASNTFNAADTINGSGGIDNINIIVDAGATLAAASVSSVENVFLRNVSGAGQTISGANFIGHQQIWNDRSTSSVTITNAASGAAIGVKGDNVTTLSATTATYVDAATAATLAITGGVKHDAGTDVTINGAGLTSATITSTGAANSIDDVTLAATIKAVTINATTNLTIGAAAGGTGLSGVGTGSTLTITGSAASVSLPDQLAANFKSVDASAFAGGVTVFLDGDADTTFKGGKGNDVVTTGAVFTTGSADAADGTGDRLIVSNSAHLATAALGAKYTNFEQLQANNGVSVNLDNISGITSLRTNGDATFTNATATQAGAITVIASGNLDIGVKGATTVGQIDTVALTVDDGATAVSTIALNTPTLTGVEKLSIAAVDNVTVTALTNALSVDTVTLTGAATQSITTGAITASNFAINGSAATGVLTLDATAATVAVALTGGTAADVLTGSAQGDSINGGAGNDTISGLAGNDTIIGGEGNDNITGGVGTDTITAGAGTDTIVYTTLTDSRASVGPDKITDFVAGTDKIDVTTVPTSILQGAVFTAAGTGTLATDIGNALTAGGGGAIGANAVAVVTITGTGAGTYLVINDGVAGYSDATDAVINITGLTGTLQVTDFV